MTRRRVIRTGDEENASHRSDFETCPHCEHKASWRQWEKRDRVLILEPRYERSGHAVIASECPKCFVNSWVHRRFVEIESPKMWAKAATKQSAALHLAAVRKLGESLCWRCDKLDSATVEHHAWVHCQDDARSGPAETTCDKFRDYRSGEEEP